MAKPLPVANGPIKQEKVMYVLSRVGVCAYCVCLKRNCVTHSDCVLDWKDC